MIIIKSEEEIKKIKNASKVVAMCHQEIKKIIKPGTTTEEIDQLVEKITLDNGGSCPCKGYYGFPAATCISVNEMVVHGFPSKYVLQEGDIVTVDIVVKLDGYHGDSAWTYPVGKVSKEKENLLQETEEALYAGLNQIKEGIHLSDVSHAIEEVANKYKLGIVREMCGHGIGKELHEDPQVLNYGAPGRGPILKEGMVMAVEPMLNAGTHRIKIHKNGWETSTSDKKPSAHFEHTIVVRKNGYEILTTL